ncbi:MAG: hypothetical protein AAF682_26595 [Planctomycetota bacterium]
MQQPRSFRSFLASLAVVGASALATLLLTLRIATPSRAEQPASPEAADASHPAPACDLAHEHAAGEPAPSAPPWEPDAPGVEAPRPVAAARDTASQSAEPTSWSELEPLIYEEVLGSGFSHDAQLRKYAGWGDDGAYRPDYRSERLNPDGKAIDEVARAELDAIADAFDPQVAADSQHVVDGLYRALEDLWSRRAFEAAQVEPGAPSRVLDHAARASQLAAELGDEGALAHVQAFHLKGWDVVVAVDSTEFPDLGDAVYHLRETRTARDRALREYVSGLP